MTITPITDKTPACFGVVCEKHGQCQRYANVEASEPHNTIGTCVEHDGSRPLFIERKDPQS